MPAADIAALLHEVLERLERIETTVTARRASLRRSPGRSRHDDADSLREIRQMIADGFDRWKAVASVAAALGGDAAVHSNRLRRKLRRGSRS